MEIKIIPQPVIIRVSEDNSKFLITQDTVIQTQKETKEIAEFFNDLIKSSIGFSLKILNISDKVDSNSIVLKIEKIGDQFGSEGYNLSVKENAILINSSTPAGIFYGIQSLRQLLPLEIESKEKNIKLKLEIPCVKINDYPRFNWRGFMVDEGRWFLGKDAIKNVLDFMAMIKLNVLHWHLTEDQGWRIEIKKYPNLVKIGSKRKGTPTNRHTSRVCDNVPHEGYYTQEDISEIVEYAQSRFIEIVPEVEIPGHSMSALKSYPELGCTGEKFEEIWKWGVKKEVYCGGNPKVIEFLEDVLNEVVELFPSKYFHIGGDEVPKARWKECPKCQARIKELNLNNEAELQIHMTNHFVNFLANKGKETIVWNDEVVDETLDKRTICQYWRGRFSKIIDFLEKGGKIIVSPSNRYYVDVSYNFTPLDQTYLYEIEGIEESKVSNVLGVEGEAWGEVTNGLKKLQWNSFPRLCAIAESGWTPIVNKNLETFNIKIDEFLRRLDIMGINHAIKAEYYPSFFRKLFGKRKGYYA